MEELKERLQTWTESRSICFDCNSQLLEEEARHWLFLKPGMVNKITEINDLETVILKMKRCDMTLLYMRLKEIHILYQQRYRKGR